MSETSETSQLAGAKSAADEINAAQEKGVSQNREPVLFSASCREWKPASTSEPVKTGFYRREGTTVFVDESTRSFVTVEGKSAPFFSNSLNPEWTFTATSSGFNSIQNDRSLGAANLPAALTLRDLIASSEEQAVLTKTSNRWIVILLENSVRLAVVLQGDLCAAAPHARYVTCEPDTLECSFFPKSFEIENEDRVARSCLKDLKMGVPEKVQPLVKACEFFQSSAYEEIRREVLTASAPCGPKAQKAVASLPSLKRIETACTGVPSSLLQLTESR